MAGSNSNDNIWRFISKLETALPTNNSRVKTLIKLASGGPIFIHCQQSLLAATLCKSQTCELLQILNASEALPAVLEAALPTRNVTTTSLSKTFESRRLLARKRNNHLSRPRTRCVLDAGSKALGHDGYIKICDFGIAEILHHSWGGTNGRTLVVDSTCWYSTQFMSPAEQLVRAGHRQTNGPLDL